MSFLNGARWINGLFAGALNWTPTANRSIALPDDSGTVLLDDRAIRGYRPIVTVSGDKTLSLTDSNTNQICTATSTITIPLNAAVAFPIGTEISISRNTSGTVTLALTGGATATDRNGNTNTLTSVTNYTLLKKVGTDAWIVINPVPNNFNLPGNPTCNTQALGTNNTTVANTAFVENIAVARVDNLSKVRYLFVIAGESNSGGTAPNSTLTAIDLVAQPHAKIWNNTSSVFQPLQIGTNNLISHTDLTDNTTHSIERGLAREILNTLQWPEAYILKAGQGGSTIAQWSVGNASGYLSTLTSRYNASVSALTTAGFIVRPVFIWIQGINDAIAATNATIWRTATQAHFVQIRSLMGATTPIFMPLLMTNTAAKIALNTEINTIDAADANMWALPTSGITSLQGDGNHYTANGYLQISRAFIDSFRSNLGVPGTFSIGQARTASSNPVVSLKRTTTLSTPAASNAFTPIPLNFVEYDTDNIFNATNGTVVIQQGTEGFYDVTGMVAIDGGAQQVRAVLYINGAIRAQSSVTLSSSDNIFSEEFTRGVRLNVGDVVSLYCYQINTTSAAKNLVITPEFQACLQMTRTGP